MSASPHDERRYSEREMEQILERAVEGEPLDLAEAGRTLAEIKEIAAEVGIDPARVESAALTLRRPGALGSPRFRALGAPTSYVFEASVPGVLPADEMPEFLALIRRVMTRQGIVQGEFDSVHWRAADAFGARYVSVTPGKNEVQLRTMGNFRDGVLSVFAPGLTVLGIGGVAAAAKLGLAAVLGLWTVPLVAAGAWLPTRWFYGWLSRREAKRLEALSEQLVRRLEDVVVEANDPEIDPGAET